MYRLTMSVLIKSVAERLPHPLLLRLHFHYSSKREAALARQISKIADLPLLETLDLAQLKKSDTVFVLGSGWSINNISDERWGVIADHDSFALNYWPVHPFVPKMHLFENIYSAESSDVKQFEAMFNAFQGLMSRRADDYRNVTKIVSELQPLSRRQLVFDIPQDYRRKLYLGYSVAVVARNEPELVAGIRYLRRQGIFASSAHIPWHFNYGGSVTKAMSLAVRMGYRRIVLCGVDLGKEDCFYHEPARYPDACNWQFVPRSESHGTTLRLKWRLSAQEAICLFKSEVLDPAGIQLFVESRSSTLFPRVPEAPPNLFQSLVAHPPGLQ